MTNKVSFDKSPSYSIRLRGTLDPKWSEWFDGFEIAYQEDDTILNGSVHDQAALHGVIAKIRDLGLPIIYVKCLECDDGG